MRAARILPIASLVLTSALYAQPLSFEVASVRQSSEKSFEVAPKLSGGNFTWRTDLRYLMGYAYRMQPFRISGPIPGSERLYQIDAKTSATATDDEVRQMLQSLLSDRFKMVSHITIKEVDGYALSVARSGLKISETRPDDPPPPVPEETSLKPADIPGMEGRIFTTSGRPGILTTIARRVSMTQVAEALQRQLGKPVLDETGLKGNYYFVLRYTLQLDLDDTEVPSLFVAVQNDLGLHLERHKGLIEMLVVDSIERTPTEN